MNYCNQRQPSGDEQLLVAMVAELIRATKTAKQSLADGSNELEKTLAERGHDRAEDR